MFRYIMGLYVLMVLSISAFAQALPPQTVEDMAPYWQQLFKAVTSGDWKVAAGIFLMLFMAVIFQYVLPTAKINRDHLPFIVAIVSGLSFAGMGMLTPDVSVIDAIKQGLITAFVAGGLWDVLGKYLAKLLLGAGLVKPTGKSS